MSKVFAKTEIRPEIVERINREIKVMVDGAIKKVIWDKKCFDSFALAIPATIKMIIKIELERYPELDDSTAVKVAEKAIKFGEKEIKRFFESCGKDIRKHKRKAGKKDET